MLNAAKPTLWRAWLLVAVACWACVAPAVALTFTPGFALRGPETRVGDFFAGLAHSRLAESPQVADPHQGEAAHGYETASGVHDYLYAHADPVMGRDPSGESLLSEITSVLGVIGNLARMTVPHINTYYRVQNMLHTVQLIKSVVSGDLTKFVKESVQNSLGGFKLPGFNPSEASEALARNLDDVLLFTAEFWGKYVVTHGASIDKILIYMPAPFYTPERLISTKVSIGAKALNLKLGLVFGTSGPRKSGRVVGFGIGTKDGGRHQMWRMDYHREHNEKTSGRELAWNDGINRAYNFHVNESP